MELLGGASRAIGGGVGVNGAGQGMCRCEWEYLLFELHIPGNEDLM